MPKKPNTDDTESDILHSPFQPLEVREGDEIGASVRIGGRVFEARVWRYSPFGVEFLWKSEFRIKRGDTLDLSVRFGTSTVDFVGLVVSDVYDSNGIKLIGIRTFVSALKKKAGLTARRFERWVCAPAFLPTGFSVNPVQFNDHIVFRVEEISAAGMRIVTSMRNKMLAVGQRLDTSISLPLIGSLHCTFLIKHIGVKTIGDKEFITCGVEFLDIDEVFKLSIAEYLLNFSEGATVHSLKKRDFPIRSVAKWFDFSYVKTESEYKDVLALRCRAYSDGSKRLARNVLLGMGDEFDARARILIIKFKGNIIGTARMMFHNAISETEHGRYLKYPPGFPDVSNCVEITRVAVEEKFRGTDVFDHIFAHAVLTTIKSGRRYITAGAAGPLVSLYLQTGFSLAGLRYNNRVLGRAHELLIMDTHRVALGKGIGFKRWNKIFGKVTKYMIEQELISPSSLQRFELFWKRLLWRYHR